MVMKIDVPLEPRVVPVAPSEERWREMTKAEREAFIVNVNEALSFNRRLQRKDDRPTLDILQAEVCIYRRIDERNDPAHLIQRITDMVTSLKRKNDVAEKEAEANRQTIREMIRNILTANGVRCSPSAIETLEACTDANILKQWVNRALTAKTEAEVFGE